ncbi:MAG TPA: BMP family protein [Candidatus Acidoferrales bacterium]|nr:BMP family protein [Candidatus Acidoferrales bacterium]
MRLASHSLGAVIATAFALLCVGSASNAWPLPAPSAKSFKVALILGGRVNEPGYYNAGYQALLSLKQKYNAEIAYEENLQPADAEQVLRALAEDGFRYVIVMGGGTYDDFIRDVAADYPAMRFIIISGGFTQLPSIVSIRTGHPGVPFLAGVLMAEMSKTKKIGLIGGRASPPAVADHVAVIAGAKFACPQIQILDTYTENYDDPSIGKEAALAQIDEGADLIFANANTTSFGVFQAARERAILAIGAATDQNGIAPDTILTSAAYGMDNAVEYLIDLDRSARGWQNKVYTTELTMVDLAPFHSLDSRVPIRVRQKLAEVRQQLIAGKITIPASYDQLHMHAPIHK